MAPVAVPPAVTLFSLPRMSSQPAASRTSSSWASMAVLNSGTNRDANAGPTAVRALSVPRSTPGGAAPPAADGGSSSDADTTVGAVATPPTCARAISPPWPVAPAFVADSTTRSSSWKKASS
ncbi:hypothetical protein VaNZ11_014698 [Volvox africanus]|uniref:Uncharacterized protein n=1 Tax=Volvox africanus TaxID=51714 RepID=A0ABQ5SK04_9CHLO|nr:hypothetical protein VaNZ11_014698 [Volvox africanus]